jgi:hypothetical protein
VTFSLRAWTLQRNAILKVFSITLFETAKKLKRLKYWLKLWIASRGVVTEIKK